MRLPLRDEANKTRPAAERLGAERHTATTSAERVGVRTHAGQQKRCEGREREKRGGQMLQVRVMRTQVAYEPASSS